MGKPTGKKKQQRESTASTTTTQDEPHHSKQQPPPQPKKKTNNFPKAAIDEDTALFITMARELKQEGYKLFQKKDHDGAMLWYEKALKLLPEKHIDVASLRTNMAACYMGMGIGEYPRAVNECNLALDVAPKYSKALLRRAKCFEALDRLDLAWKDVRLVLSMEPNNLTALEVMESVRKGMEEKGVVVEELENGVLADGGAATDSKQQQQQQQPDSVLVGLSSPRAQKQTQAKGKKSAAGKDNNQKNNNKKKKQKMKKAAVAAADATLEVNQRDLGYDFAEEDKSKPEDKEVVVQEEVVESPAVVKDDKVVSRTAKLVLGDDIRWAQIPTNCSLALLRDIVRDRFPNLKGALVKYKDQESDLITITTMDELRKVESAGDSEGCLRLYVAEVSPDQEPGYEDVAVVCNADDEYVSVMKGGKEVAADDDHQTLKKGQERGKTCVDIWILQFAEQFKNLVGLDSDSCLNLCEIGSSLYSEAMEESVASEDAQKLFDLASVQFQEMAALAMFNWGNVHMNKATKHVHLPLAEDNHNTTNELVLNKVKEAYEWAKREYTRAGSRYLEAIKIKPDFYEGYLALGLQQFEQAKLCWVYAVTRKEESEENVSSEILHLYNQAEDSMETGMQIWEEIEERRLNGISREDEYKPLLQRLGLSDMLRRGVGGVSNEEDGEETTIMKARVYIMWGSLLYERSIVEFKLGLPTWEECLEVAVEKFGLAGASQTDIAVLIKNHCAHQTAQDGLGFKIDEIVQAWHEMYDAKRWLLGVSSFRLEPLFRRRVPSLHQILEHHHV